MTARPRPRARPRGGRKRAAPAAEVLARLRAAYPDAACALQHRDAYELLCATILSAQCTDARVNLVTPGLFARYPHPEALAAARQTDVEEIIRSTGFFRNKARAIPIRLVADHGGEVPRSMAQLRGLPGVGRKTANVVLGNAFLINEGVTVDTHVARLSQRLGLTRHQEPEKIERDLMALIPMDDWALISHLLIFHGRRVCVARRPRCGECVLVDICPSARL